ncbi:hypothetical protein JYT28_01650, partial [Desulfobulbus sp. AH-315-M07]|nr:hypothetical protein [Desulfobulbus sp. AH-315-M07]
VAWWDGFSVLDVSNPDDPVTVIENYYSGATSDCHNVWPSKDHKFALTTDETAGGYLRVFDLSDPNNVEQVAEWWTDPSSIVHNVHVRGDYAFVAYYTDGLVVLDISDPTNPQEVARYDTMAADGGHGAMYGNWGVWPYGEHLATGDTEAGLVMFDFFPAVVTPSGEYLAN